MAEEQRYVHRTVLRYCEDISLQFDERKGWDDFSFRACDKRTMTVVQGSFGVSYFGSRDHDDKEPDAASATGAKPKSVKIKLTFDGVLRAFCTHGFSADPGFAKTGEHDMGLENHIRSHLTSIVVDGDMGTQQGARAIAAALPNSVLVSRDLVHEVQRLFDEVSARDPQFGMLETEWLTKQHSFIKLCNYSVRMKKEVVGFTGNGPPRARLSRLESHSLP